MATMAVKYIDSGKAFGEAMEAAGYTVTTLSRELGVTFATISRIRNGQTYPRVELAMRLNKALNVDMFMVPGVVVNKPEPSTATDEVNAAIIDLETSTMAANKVNPAVTDMAKLKAEAKYLSQVIEVGELAKYKLASLNKLIDSYSW